MKVVGGYSLCKADFTAGMKAISCIFSQEKLVCSLKLSKFKGGYMGVDRYICTCNVKAFLINSEKKCHVIGIEHGGSIWAWNITEMRVLMIKRDDASLTGRWAVIMEGL